MSPMPYRRSHSTSIELSTGAWRSHYLAATSEVSHCQRPRLCPWYTNPYMFSWLRSHFTYVLILNYNNITRSNYILNSIQSKNYIIIISRWARREWAAVPEEWAGKKPSGCCLAKLYLQLTSAGYLQAVRCILWHLRHRLRKYNFLCKPIPHLARSGFRANNRVDSTKHLPQKSYRTFAPLMPCYPQTIQRGFHKVKSVTSWLGVVNVQFINEAGRSQLEVQALDYDRHSR